MRNDSITILKGFGILFMVMAHAGCPKILHDFIYMFHMPLFFMASGYCFKEKYLQDNKGFIVRRIKGLYIPFVKWSLIFLALHNVFFYLNIYNDSYGFHGEVSYLYAWRDFAKDCLFILTRMTDNAQLLGGYWFLREMFFGTILSLFLMKYIRSDKMCLMLMLCLTITSKTFHLHVPYFEIGSLTFFSASFFIAGRVTRRFLNVKCIKDRGVSVLLFIIVCTGSVLIPTNMIKFSSGQILPYFICAMAGTWLFFNISTALANSQWKKFMLFVGNNTMPILTWHFLCFKLVSLLIINIYGLSVERLAEFPIIEEYSSWWTMYFIMGVSVPLIGILCYKKFEFKKDSWHKRFI